MQPLQVSVKRPSAAQAAYCNMSLPSEIMFMLQLVIILQKPTGRSRVKVSEKKQKEKRLTRLGLIDGPTVKAAAVSGGGKVVTPALCPVALVLGPAHHKACQPT